MELGAELKRGVLVVKAHPRLDSSNAGEFEDALRASLKGHVGNVVVDMTELTYISSAGLRAILLVTRTLRKTHQHLAICSLSDNIKELFRVSGFDKVIETHDSQVAAVEAVG